MQNETLGDWYGIWLVFVMNLGAFVGRLVPEGKIPKSSEVITSFVWARLLFIPGVFFTVQRFSDPFSISSLLLFLGLTNG